MRRIFSPSVPLALLMAALAIASMSGAPLLRAQSTAMARAALEGVSETAKAWRADAVLTNISAEEVGPDGAARVWDYLFFSPSYGKFGRISARMVAGEGFRVRETNRGPREAIPADFADSDKVIAQARWNGLNLREYILGLTSRGWAVYPSLRRGDSIIWLDARTAAYLRTEAIPRK
jgi:hypothetical protein